MKKRKNRYLIVLNEVREPNTNLVVLRAILDSNFTRFDFGYIATSDYIKGGWIRISPETHLKVSGSNKKFILTRAEGIPIAPEHYHFESNKDWQYFSLYFPPIPQESCAIDIIEEENPDENDFNFYSLKLDFNDSLEVISTD